VAICCACWHVAWRAKPPIDHLPALDAPRIVDERLECRDCGGRPHQLIAKMHESPTRPAAATTTTLSVVRRQIGARAGQFATIVCEQCGRLEWFACDVSAFDGNAFDEPCRRCKSAAMRSVRPFREEDGRPLPVTVELGVGRGELELRWCDECGACDWRAHDVAKLAAKHKQIVDARERVPVAGGPYR
jgi:predicted nucleic-acid-binding Zn-ribbon protein